MMTAPTSAPPLTTVLRLTALRNPDRAAHRLHRLLTEPAPAADPPTVADLHALRVEALLQAGHLDAALHASIKAARAAGELQPQDWPRLITALLIGADLAVLAGHPHAVTACDSTRTAFTHLHQPDPTRELSAAALHAVAVYHHLDAAHGHHLLNTLARHNYPPTSQAAAIRGGLAAMHTGMSSGRLRGAQHQISPPIPGGLLHPHPTAAATGWLAARVHAQPAHIQTDTP